MKYHTKNSETWETPRVSRTASLLPSFTSLVAEKQDVECQKRQGDAKMMQDDARRSYELVCWSGEVTWLYTAIYIVYLCFGGKTLVNKAISKGVWFLATTISVSSGPSSPQLLGHWWKAFTLLSSHLVSSPLIVAEECKAGWKEIFPPESRRQQECKDPPWQHANLTLQTLTMVPIFYVTILQNAWPFIENF